MTLLNEQNLLTTLETAVVEPRWAKIMASIGASESTAFQWRATCAVIVKNFSCRRRSGFLGGKLTIGGTPHEPGEDRECDRA